MEDVLSVADLLNLNLALTLLNYPLLTCVVVVVALRFARSWFCAGAMAAEICRDSDD